MSIYETRLVPEIKAAAKAARDAEVARCVRAFEGDTSTTWGELQEGYRQPVIDEAKRICTEHGTWPRKPDWYRDSKHCGCSQAEYGQRLLHAAKKRKSGRW